MLATAEHLMTGCGFNVVYGYTQSDEISLLFALGENGFQTTRVEAGTHLFDGFYVGYRRNFGAETWHGENTNEVRAEFEVMPHITLEGDYGDASSGGVSLFYGRDY